MSQEWFQFIANPYRRSQGYGGEYEEEVAFTPPSKPYFKGNGCVPEGHPSEALRTLIKEHLRPVESTTDSFIGNTCVSELHSLESEHNALQLSIQNDVSPLFHRNEDGSFECAVERLTLYQNYLLPGDCSLFNGDVRSFLKREQTERFDIVVVLASL